MYQKINAYIKEYIPFKGYKGKHRASYKVL